METIQKTCSYAVQDDKEYWEAKNRCNNGGKLFLIDESDFETQHIFFDDTIGVDLEVNEVDIRDIVTGAPYPYDNAINKYIVHVETNRAILENDYFTKKIEECEQKRTEEIENIKNGITGEPEIPEADKIVNEWNGLMALNANEYLSKTVLPVIYQGLKEIDIERPKDPFRMFALFLLRNQGMVKLAVKPPEPEPEPKPEAEANNNENANEQSKHESEGKKLDESKTESKKEGK